MLEMTGRFFTRLGSKRGAVSPGSVYKKQRSSGLIETAKVLDVGRDDMGILHVHYETTLCYRGGRSTKCVEKRRLNLVTFSSRFCDA